MTQHLKSEISSKISLKQTSVKNLIDIQQIAEDQIYLFSKKSQQNLYINQEKHNFNISNKDQQNVEQNFPFELQMKWRRLKQKITNTRNMNNLQQDQQFIYKRQIDEEESGYTIIDEQTNENITINGDCIKKQYLSQNNQNVFNENYQIFTKNNSVRSKYSTNIKKGKQNIMHSNKNAYSDNISSFNLNIDKNEKKSEYRPQQDRNLTNFFTNKRTYLSCNKSQNSMRQAKINYNTKVAKNKQIIENYKSFNSRIKNRHTFTNDNQCQRKDKQNKQKQLKDKINKLRIRPQTVKNGNSNVDQFNINNIIDLQKNQKIQPLSKLSLNQCQINAIINSNINHNKKIIKFMQLNEKFYKKYYDSELTNFINFNSNINSTYREQKIDNKSYLKDSEKANYKINQNQQKLKAQKQEISVKQQRNLQSVSLQMQREIVKLQTKVSKKLPYLLKMGVNFKLKQKKKEKTKY